MEADSGHMSDASDHSENMEESDEDYCTVRSTSHNTNQDGDLLQPKQKRKRKEGRKRIRKILTEAELDSETLSAQKEEQERLRRLELQKSLNTLASVSVTQSTPPLDKSSFSLYTSKPTEKPVLVNVSVSKAPDRIIIIDDSDDESDVVETLHSTSDCVIEISDSETEMFEEEEEANEEPENSGSHTNDDVNQPDVQGRVLVNVNHPPSEPDIFLASHLCQVVKPHQIGGIRFLYDNLVESLSRYAVSPGFGCILAHSMGLGKTLQLICFIDVFLRSTTATKILCIVPMNTIQNWFSEFNTWLPEVVGQESTEKGDDQGKQGRTFQVLLLSENVKTTVARSILIAKWENEGGVLLMGYEMYRILAMYTPSLVNNTKLTGSKRKRTNASTTEVIDLDEEEKNMDLLLEIQKSLCKPGPDLVVCDEGHRIKNSQANISQALKKIHTRRRVVLTGYPLQNNLLEYWCMVDFVRPNFLGTKHEFSNMFERPIINGQCVDSTASDTKLMRFRAHVLHSLLEGFVQRRSEAVLTKTLPAKEEYVIPVKMTPIQMSLYEEFVSSVKNYVGYINPIKAFGICIKIWNHPDILKNYLDSKKDANRNDSPLTVVDPDLDIGEMKKTKEPKGVARLQPSSSSETTLAPPDLKTMTTGMDWVGALLDNYKHGVLQHGAKMVLLMEIIEKSIQTGDKILVFSQSLSTLGLIEDFLRKRVVPPFPSQLMFQPANWERNKNYYRLDGSTSSQEREKLITAFNSKSNHSVFLFLLSTRACSLGVNLIGANRVVIFDASWNPCHDAQAVCRIYRYGQTKKCFIYRLVSHGTFEKRMYERQVTKEGMSDRVIDELNPEANLTKQEVMHLFKETENNETEDALDIAVDAFPDSVLNHVCSTCQKSIFEIPFKHKLQSSHEPKNVLTKAEKREAKKGYEREKRAIDSANKYNFSATTCSPLLREQLRKEVANRPIGHVKPIQNVQASTFVRTRLSSPPIPLQLPANPFRHYLPSMASMAGLTFPPVLNNRYFQVGDFRPLSPYPVNFPFSVPGMSSGPISVGQANLKQPIDIDLFTSPDENHVVGGELDDPIRITETEKVGVGSSKLVEVLKAQSLSGLSVGLTGVAQTTAGTTSEQSVVSSNGNENELRKTSSNTKPSAGGANERGTTFIELSSNFTAVPESTRGLQTMLNAITNKPLPKTNTVVTLPYTVSRSSNDFRTSGVTNDATELRVQPDSASNSASNHLIQATTAIPETGGTGMASSESISAVKSDQFANMTESSVVASKWAASIHDPSSLPVPGSGSESLVDVTGSSAPFVVQGNRASSPRRNSLAKISVTQASNM